MTDKEIQTHSILEIKERLWHHEILINNWKDNCRYWFRDCTLPQCPHKRQLQTILLETVQVLE